MSQMLCVWHYYPTNWRVFVCSTSIHSGKSVCPSLWKHWKMKPAVEPVAIQDFSLTMSASRLWLTMCEHATSYTVLIRISSWDTLEMKVCPLTNLSAMAVSWISPMFDTLETLCKMTSVCCCILPGSTFMFFIYCVERLRRSPKRLPQLWWQN